MRTVRYPPGPARGLLGWGRLIACACAAAALLTIATPAPGSAAVARPAAAKGCVNTLADDPPEVCVYVAGTGTHIDYIKVSVDSGYRAGKFRVTGPHRQSYFSKVMDVRGGNAYKFAFKRHLPPGKYWGYFWLRHLNGTFTPTAGAYVTVR